MKTGAFLDDSAGWRARLDGVRSRCARAWVCAMAVAAAMGASGGMANAEFTATIDPGSTMPVLTVNVPEVISKDIDPAIGYYSIINAMVGAERFYLEGYFGSNAMIANVEAGHVWNGHETMGTITSYVSNSPVNATANQYDYHATAVGFIMSGIPAAPPYYYYQFGMSPLAQLTSVSIATGWGSGGEFSISSSTLVYGYKTVMADGVSREIIPGLSIIKPVDVVNSSWGFTDAAGSEQPTLILDALAFANHQTVCFAAGNHESGTAQVSGPASGFNGIAVGAMGNDMSTPPYSGLASFSNTGPNDFYNPATGQTIHNVRPAVAIVAPGSDLVLAAYIGPTGTNMHDDLFDLTGIDPADYGRLYFVGADGTSFASPVVAGGAGLVVDAGYAKFGGGQAVDGRVIKAVLLNSARKPSGWNNNTLLNGGVLRTSQGLDFNFGAGVLNLDRAYDQYLSGTANVPGLGGGTVHTLGWDFGRAGAGAPNEYVLDTPLQAGELFTATLTWFVAVTFNTAATADPVTDAFSDADLHADYFDQLDLQVWRLKDGVFDTLIAESTSPYNNVDHLYFVVPEDGDYALRVSWLGSTYDLAGTSPHADEYGLAWSATVVPESGFLLVWVGAAGVLLGRGRGGIRECRSCRRRQQGQRC